ncbi:MAG: GNAT family N-acetyltransferase, partial [Trueperaceae bacterium]
RLRLRPFERRDWDAYLAYASRPDVVRYMYWEPHDEAAHRARLEKYLTRTRLAEEGDVLTLAVEPIDAGDGASGGAMGDEVGVAMHDAVDGAPVPSIVGEVLLVWRSLVHRQGEFGFAFHPDFQGKGYATEAAGAMLDLAFDRLDLHRVFGRCDARNRASGRLMARLGMRREAHLVENEWIKGEWTNEEAWAILQREWHAHRAAADE